MGRNKRTGDMHVTESRRLEESGRLRSAIVDAFFSPTFHEGWRLQHGEQGALEDHADGSQHKHSPHQGSDAEERSTKHGDVTDEQKVELGPRRQYARLCFCRFVSGRASESHKYARTHVNVHDNICVCVSKQVPIY